MQARKIVVSGEAAGLQLQLGPPAAPGRFDSCDLRHHINTDISHSLHFPQRIPKKHRARVYMLRTGVEGWTENDILKYCRLSSGRNYATELERELNITLERQDEKNPDGIGAHYRYRLASRGDALRVIKLVNHNAAINQHSGLSQQDITDILNLCQ